MPIDLWYIVPALVTAGCYFAQWCYTQLPVMPREIDLTKAMASKTFVGLTLQNRRGVAPSVIHARGAFGLGGPMCAGAAAALQMNDGRRAQERAHQMAHLQGTIGSQFEALRSQNHAFMVQQHAMQQHQLQALASNEPGRLIKVDDLHGVGVFKMPPFPKFPDWPGGLG